MRKIFFVAFFIVSLFSTFCANADGAKIMWTTVKDHQSLDEVIGNAISQSRSAVLYFFADWSVDANRTEKNLWVPKKGLEKFTFIKVDVTAWGDEEKLLSTRYGLSQNTYIPILVMLDAKGREIKASRIAGAKILTTNAFELWLHEKHLLSGSPSLATVLSTDREGTPKVDAVDSIFDYKINHKNSSVMAVFSVAPGYYLYRDKFKIAINGYVVPRADLSISGTPVRYTDDAWGEQVVFESHVQIEYYLGNNNFLICNPGAANQIELFYQGAGKAGLFYPPQKRTMQFTVSC